MTVYQIIFACIAAYIIGSVPTAVWVGRLFHGVDVRQHGSGNAGATNTIRVLGWKTGVPVLLVDVLKGWVAAALPLYFADASAAPETIINYQILTGLIAIIGHIFPLFAGFRGGKGVATTFGFLLALSLPVTLICLGVFLAVLLISGYVSLSSIAAGVCYPIVLLLFFNSPSILFRYFSIFIAIALIATHQKNIVRLMRGEEKKFIRKRE
jgi:acyl phosphate:glycerol-3-phosphate acyltransferase